MPRAETDSQLSIQADEFVWSEEGLTEAHTYLLPTIREWLRRSGARKVLDIGCGNGAVTAALAADGYDVVGVDMSETGIAIAQRTYPNVDFRRAELSEPFPDEFHRAFDAVIAVEVIEHLLLPCSLFDRAREALRPHGSFIVTTPYHGFLKNVALALTNRLDDHWHPLRDYGHVKFFSQETLTRLFVEQGLPVTKFRRVGRIPPLAKSMIVQGELAP